MIDRNVSLISTVAYTLWALGAVFIGLDFFFEPHFHAIGLFLAGAGGVVHIRSFFACQKQREQDAYDLGRETVRHLR